MREAISCLDIMKAEKNRVDEDDKKLPIRFKKILPTAEKTERHWEKIAERIFSSSKKK